MMTSTPCFSKLFSNAAIDTSTTEHPSRFLSRYYKSATNIKESQLCIEIGQVNDLGGINHVYCDYMGYLLLFFLGGVLMRADIWQASLRGRHCVGFMTYEKNTRNAVDTSKYSLAFVPLYTRF